MNHSHWSFTTFADISVFISQDDKAKIGLGVPAVGFTFCILQSINESKTITDQYFPMGFRQNLILASLDTSSLTHIQDLKRLASNSQYDDMLKINGIVRSIWILLVNEGPDENPNHLKNIKAYCQSKYNSIERDIATLYGKLAGITLPIDYFGIHLNTQGKVIDPELAV
ncbi:14479_t:CDS:2 [Funneliformis geosporum]|uniref:14479_t:CDS:1 n=1 Tax=Funneliformis geosporum TaxID=1117311 RepID=A0A9W4SJG3_9GLOM|nr:14479_t:CDS:2 [Funneliformis geosporum]